MAPVIFVGSYKGSPFLQDCLNSIPKDIECIVVRNGGYECGCLSYVQKHFQGEEFLFLQDSTKVKDATWIYDIFSQEGIAWCLSDETGWGSMYMAKYRMEHFRKLVLPETKTKMDAVVAEMAVPNAYSLLDETCKVLWPDFRLESATRGNIHGRDVMIYENEHFIKYKSCWGGWMVGDCCKRDQEFRNAIS